MNDKKRDVEVINGKKTFNATTFYGSGLINLMYNYDLTWDEVYNIVQKAINEGVDLNE